MNIILMTMSRVTLTRGYAVVRNVSNKFADYGKGTMAQRIMHAKHLAFSSWFR